jgi:hypothetical protein
MGSPAGVRTPWWLGQAVAVTGLDDEVVVVDDEVDEPVFLADASRPAAGNAWHSGSGLPMV